MPRTQARTMKAALYGLAAGLLLLALFLTPFGVRAHIQAMSRAILQEYLMPSRGEAFGDYDMVPVSMTALLGGSPSDGMSVSPDGYRWLTPENGELRVQMIPGDYTCTVLYENRMVTAQYSVTTGAESSPFILDIHNAPDAPELLLLECQSNGGIELFPLDISNASRVSIDEAPSGVEVVRTAEGYALSVDPEMLSLYFYHLTLRAYNDYGQAESHIGIRIRRSETVIPIYTANDLDAMRTGLSGSYLLCSDIDMSDVHDWKPIGTGGNPFTGVLDGGGYEITGFHAPDTIPDDYSFGLFETLQGAEIRNLTFREPEIAPSNVSGGAGCCVLAANVSQSLIESCAIIGGRVEPADGGAGSFSIGGGNVILIDLFNSADVICRAANSYLKNTGGIFGIMAGYGTRLVNEGEVYGTHLTGGIVGFQVGGYLGRCVNRGFIWGSTFLGEYPCGGIIQSSGGTVAYSYTEIGQAGVGGSTGRVNSLLAVTAAQLLDPQALAYLGTFDGDSPQWTYAGPDAKGPVPYSIFGTNNGSERGE